VKKKKAKTTLEVWEGLKAKGEEMGSHSWGGGGKLSYVIILILGKDITPGGGDERVPRHEGRHPLEEGGVKKDGQETGFRKDKPPSGRFRSCKKGGFRLKGKEMPEQVPSGRGGRVRYSKAIKGKL